MFVREQLHGIDGRSSTGVDTLRGGEERLHEQEERVFYAEGAFAGCDDEDEVGLGDYVGLAARGGGVEFWWA